MVVLRNVDIPKIRPMVLEPPVFKSIRFSGSNSVEQFPHCRKYVKDNV